MEKEREKYVLGTRTLFERLCQSVKRERAHTHTFIYSFKIH